jgi:uncharacterized protein YbjT (DUF2867 family)
VLIVGCGCRGRALAGALATSGHAVRGTTRDPDAVAPITAAGAEGVIADPDRLGTLLGHLSGVSVLCWLLGSATGENVADLHGPRLQSLLEKLVDTPVRGIVYEGAGTVDAGILAAGAASVARAGETFRMPTAVVVAPPAPLPGWVAAMRAAVDDVLSIS